jgi:hypothetical protein
LLWFVFFVWVGIISGLAIWAVAKQQQTVEGPPGTCPLFCFNGTDGTNGTSPTIVIGNVTTTPAGTNATVTNAGNGTYIVLNISIPQGPAGGMIDYVYVYNLSPQSVAQSTDITFDTTGVITSGFLHLVGGSDIFVVNTGVYEIMFSVTGSTPNEFGVFLSNVQVPSIIYGTLSGQNVGTGIFSATVGQYISVRNYLSSATVVLGSPTGGAQPNVNAMVRIFRIA